MNGIMYDEDKQIYKSTVTKNCTASEQTVIVVSDYVEWTIKLNDQTILNIQTEQISIVIYVYNILDNQLSPIDC